MNNKKNKGELVRIFAVKRERSEFINEYMFFDSDDNFLFYKSFILNNYKSNETELLIELMELSIKIDYHNGLFFKHLWGLFKNKKFWYRLAFMDYTFSLRTKIEKNLYRSVNEAVVKQVSNFEIKFQACINLYAEDISYDGELFHLISLANAEANHYALYRVAVFLNNSMEFEGKQVFKKKFRKLLESNDSPLPNSQRKEILSSI